MPKLLLTDRYVASDNRIPKEGRAEFADTMVPGLRLRVSSNGFRSWILIKRFPGSIHPSRRSLGRYPIVSLDMARDEALDAMRLARKGVDFKQEQRKAKAEAERAKSGTFDLAIKDFVENHVRRRARPIVNERLIHTAFTSKWQRRQLADITRQDCASVIRALAKSTPKGATAYICYSHLRRFFNWCLATGKLDHSPMTGLRPADVIGKDREARDRILSEDEVRAIWQAADKVGYVFGDLIKLLFFTGARLHEVSELRWSEIDMDNRRITVPARRVKTKVDFVIPITDDMAALLNSLPRFVGGDFLFSSRGGRSPFVGHHRAQQQLMELSGVTGWTRHDVRRSVRSYWSPIPGISDTIKELSLGHTQPGVRATYDRYRYLDERLQLLNLWHAKLRTIVNPPPAADVIPLKPRRRVLAAAE